MIRVADYVAETLAKHGLRHVFMVTGGGAMHLNDAFGRCKDLSYVCCHHEQACSMAAQGYFRLTNRPAIVNVTAGPGATNAVTGVFGAWTDSLGMVVVSGQAKRETLMSVCPLPIRQLGDQEVDIISMVKSITKYAVMVTEPQDIRYHLERAIHLASHGRPGPVWLDIPVDVQGTKIDPATLRAYDPAEDAVEFAQTDLNRTCGRIFHRLLEGRRPVIYAGAGVRLAGATEQFLELAEQLRIPVVTGFNAHDLIPTAHPCYVGRPGTIGDRSGNFAVQNSDVLLVLGCRLNIRQISYAWQHFARAAYKIVVDIDEAELRKPTIKPDLAVHADAADVIRGLLQIARGSKYASPASHLDWLKWCKVRLAKYPVVLPEYWQTVDKVNPYCFAERLFDLVRPDEIIITGDATACIATFQAADIKPGMRLFSDSGCAPMGFDLPAAIGACVGAGGQRVICLAGDGSIMMNLQELQTIAGLRLPIKIFVLNNNGYHSIRQTQTNFFAGNSVGCGPESGVTFPDFERIASAFELPFRKVSRHSELSEGIEATLKGSGPALCEIVLDQNQPFAPKLASKRLPDGRLVTAPLEDMTPILERGEFLSNMLVPALD
jgi:acetolactate synthase I/II/III large subunit